MTISAVLFDFYGTLARATRWVSADEVLNEHGYTLTDEQRAIYFADGLDGVEHDEHSQSRDHYLAWQRQRTLAMLAASDVHPGEYDVIIDKLQVGAANRQLEAYDEVSEGVGDLCAHERDVGDEPFERRLPEIESQRLEELSLGLHEQSVQAAQLLLAPLDRAGSTGVEGGPKSAEHRRRTRIGRRNTRHRGVDRRSHGGEATTISAARDLERRRWGVQVMREGRTRRSGATVAAPRSTGAVTSGQWPSRRR